jgi:hypothetical protein
LNGKLAVGLVLALVLSVAAIIVAVAWGSPSSHRPRSTHDVAADVLSFEPWAARATGIACAMLRPRLWTCALDGGSKSVRYFTVDGHGRTVEVGR